MGVMAIDCAGRRDGQHADPCPGRQRAAHRAAGQHDHGGRARVPAHAARRAGARQRLERAALRRSMQRPAGAHAWHLLQQPRMHADLEAAIALWPLNRQQSLGGSRMQQS